MRRSASEIISELDSRIARLEREAFNFKDVKDFISQRWVKDSFGLTEKDVIKAAERANFIKGFKGRPKILKAVQIKSEQGLYELLIDKGQKKEICYDDLCEETGMVDEHFLAYIYFSSPDAKPVGVEVGSVDGKHDLKKVITHLKRSTNKRASGCGCSHCTCKRQASSSIRRSADKVLKAMEEMESELEKMPSFRGDVEDSYYADLAERWYTLSMRVEEEIKHIAGAY